MGMRQLIGERFQGSLVDEADSETGVMNCIANDHYQLILLDIDIARTEEGCLVRRINVKAPDSPVLVFAAGGEEIFATQALQAGAKGYIEKTAANHEILTAMTRLLAGKYYASNSVIQELVQQPAANHDHVFSRLSPREAEVAKLLLSGMSVGDISGALAVSYITVHTFKRRIFEKLHVKNLLELAHLQDRFGEGVQPY
jgi:DNA-binding NarL/FixJ family response regulator